MISDSPVITIPLKTDKRGTIRIRDSRVTLDSLISYYLQGETPEDLHIAFPTVALSDIYAVIAYYLANRTQIDTYLQTQQSQAEDILREVETNHSAEQKATQKHWQTLLTKRKDR